jgi:hypothetical protein
MSDGSLTQNDIICGIDMAPTWSTVMLGLSTPAPPLKWVQALNIAASSCTTTMTDA